MTPQTMATFATDPRDRIYSILGMADDFLGGESFFQSKELIVDYNASVEDV
jgi:hypothetical protein